MLNEQFFNESFKGYNVPQNLKKVVKTICRKYNIKGICDPMYISNVIALEVGIGDGQSSFNDNQPNKDNFMKAASRIVNSYPISKQQENVLYIKKLLINNF